MPNQSNAVAVVPAEEPKAIVAIKAELEKRESDLLAVLPPGMDAKRFMRVSLIAISKNPALLECHPGSIIRSIVEAAEVGLEPTGSLNRAWLVPFKEKGKDRPEAQLMIGYQGYADLMRDGDQRRRVVAEVVYEGDHFKVIKGTEEPRIEHEPAFATDDPTKITHAYAIIFYPDGTNQFEVLTRKQVENARAKSRQANGPAWTQGYAKMARKTALRSLSNYTPLTARAIEAIQRDTTREFGEPGEATAAEPRAATLKERIKGNRTRRKAETPKNGRRADADAGTQETAPKKSADQQTGENAAAEPVEGQAREVCGAAGKEVAEGEVCALEPGHGGKVHKNAGGTASWPVEASK